MKRKLQRTIKQKVRGVSPVWIVPIVALVIAVWLAVQARMEKGAEIEITFTSASDIIAGQTLIKLKDVNVGKVTQVQLSEDLSSVIVTADLDRSVLSFLSENTRFWVVTPKISASGVSNLGTLINGVFILMDPGEKGKWSTKFRGLDEPPLIKSDEPGRQYILQANELSSVDIGSPIYFRQVQVGEVTGYKLSENSEHVDINIFVKEPFDSLVEKESYFWNVSGIGVSISAEGVKANMASLASLVSGGIAFENINGLSNSELALEGHRFFLYPDKDSVIQGQFALRYYYLTKFSGSVQGLSKGAPVEFKGIKVGEVVDIKLNSANNEAESLFIYLAIEPERFNENFNPTREEADRQIESMIRQGLRAQMKTGSLLTGSRYIDLVYAKERNPEFVLETVEKYSIIPTIQDSIEQLTNEVSEIVSKVNQIPFDQIGGDLARTLTSLNNLLSSMEDNDTAGNINKVLNSADETLKQVAVTLEDIDAMVAPDSALKHELVEMLDAVGDAAKSVDRFVEELNRHPNSLIFGAEKDK